MPDARYGQDHFGFPSWSTATRKPVAAGAAGRNSDTNVLEFFDGANWSQFAPINLGINHGQSYGGVAIANGATKPLSQFFPTLGSAQAVFPAALALTDELDWALLQSEIAAAPVGACVNLIPGGQYYINRALAVPGPVTLRGFGAYPVTRSVNTTFADFDSPGLAPYLAGSVIIQSAPATDAVRITGTAITANLFDFGVRFADAIRHVNTGHGVNATPASTYGSGVSTMTMLYASGDGTTVTVGFVGAQIDPIPVNSSITISGAVPAGYDGTWTVTASKRGQIQFLSSATGALTTAGTFPYNMTGHDHGLLYSNWQNVIVFGHDGDHYGFNIVNSMQCKFDRLVSFGGGGVSFVTDSFAGNYGNSVFSNPYVDLYVPGTAHGYYLSGRAQGSNGYNNLFAFLRPQCNIDNITGSSKFAEISGVNVDVSKQWAFYGSQNTGLVSISAPDFEPNAQNVQVALPNGAFTLSLDGIPGKLANSGGYFPVMRAQQGNATLGNDLRIAGATSTATAAAGANAGTSPPAPVTSNCGDVSGSVTFGTGTTPAAGAQVVVTFSQYRGTNYRLVLTPGNAATAALNLYTTKTGSNFTISAVNAPAASQANTVYSFDYQITYMN